MQIYFQVVQKGHAGAHSLRWPCAVLGIIDQVFALDAYGFAGGSGCFTVQFLSPKHPHLSSRLWGTPVSMTLLRAAAVDAAERSGTYVWQYSRRCTVFALDAYQSRMLQTSGATLRASTFADGGILCVCMHHSVHCSAGHPGCMCAHSRSAAWLSQWTVTDMLHTRMLWTSTGGRHSRLW